MLLKFLNADGTGPYSSAPWSLPNGNIPGEWMPSQPCELCVSGYHLVTVRQAPKWFDARAFLAEGAGNQIFVKDKRVYGRARLLREIRNWPLIATKWGILCASRVCANKDWAAWAQNWLHGTDRTKASAEAAAWAEAWAAGWAAAEAAAAKAKWAAATAAAEAAEKAANGVAAEKTWQASLLKSLIREAMA